MYKYFVGLSELKVGKYSPNVSRLFRHETIKSSADRITIIVRGTSYETLQTTLARFPNTLLGGKVTGSSFSQEKIYIDADKPSFEAILFYYQSGGILVRPTSVSIEDFIKSCKYFKIDEEAVANLKVREGYSISYNRTVARHGNFRQHAWLFCDAQSTSKTSIIFAVFNCSLILTSALLHCVLSAYHEYNKKHVFLMELSLNIYFSLEYLIRFLLSPGKISFIFQLFNVIDFVACCSWFLHLLLDNTSDARYTCLQISYVFSSMRLLRMGKHINTLRKISVIVLGCTRDVRMFLVCSFISCLFFASFEYYVELGAPGNAFESIPESLWWSIQTMVSLGYGDIVPVTVLGKLTASFVAIFGTITLTVPLMSLCGNVLSMYAQAFPDSSIAKKTRNL